MKEGKKKLFELIFILALLANITCVNIVKAEPMVGEKISGATRYETRFINHLGTTISSVMKSTSSLEVIEIDSGSGLYVILLSTSGPGYYSGLIINNGEWEKTEIPNYIVERGDYLEIVDNGIYSNIISTTSSLV